MSSLAIVSVYDKTGVEGLVRTLVKNGVQILSTGGTSKLLKDAQIPVKSISDYTGHPEILDGRVKSLHPKIHGGILARRDLQADLDQLRANSIEPIDYVIVNLYPFTDKVREVEAAQDPRHPSLVELIDIGGPTMIRAAAKNWEHVVAVCDPADYETVREELEKEGSVSRETRRRLAAKVFATMAAYDAAVARYFALDEKLLDSKGAPREFAPLEGLMLRKNMELRYGENPHQQAAFYESVNAGGATLRWKQLQGKEISYNNLLDMHASVDLLLELMPIRGDQQAAAIIKHTNPCGAAIRPTVREAIEAARSCDPISAFGGIIAVSGVLDDAVASTILEGFVEVVIAEKVIPEALKVFETKKNVRVIECDLSSLVAAGGFPGTPIRNCFGGYLVQSPDRQTAKLNSQMTVSVAKPNQKQLEDLDFAWRVCKHVKSNAIVIVKDKCALGVGAGQMSRVDAAKLSVDRARLHGHDITGAVAASDAFLPFPDTLEVINDAGVVALAQPGGSLKDKDVIAVADRRNAVMMFTGERHFRH